LIIAINTWWVPMDDQEEIFEALFGSPAFAYWQGMRSPSMTLTADDVFGLPKAWPTTA